MKLDASMFDFLVQTNMVTVGLVDCVREEALCKLLGRRTGVVFYPAKEVSVERETVGIFFIFRFRTMIFGK